MSAEEFLEHILTPFFNCFTDDFESRKKVMNDFLSKALLLKSSAGGCEASNLRRNWKKSTMRQEGQ